MRRTYFANKNKNMKILPFNSKMISSCVNKINRKTGEKSARFLVPLIVLLLVLPCSCNYLDYTETSNYTKDEIFLEFGRVHAALDNIYSYLPDYFLPIDGSTRACATDEAEQVLSTSSVQKFNDGSWDASNTVDDVWADMYTGIRAVNFFLVNIEGQTFPLQKYQTDYAQQQAGAAFWPYEARFLRAFFYFELVKRYHNVPLVTKVLTPEEANTVVPGSFNDVVNFIISECDAVIPNLPASYATAGVGYLNETGRATRGTAQALKARMLLYAASPLYNTSNDLQKWSDAAKAAKVIIDGGLYSPLPDYSTILNNLTSKELIFERRLVSAENYFEAANFPIGYEGGNTGTCPSQNLVDAYEMKTTGLDINAPGSGYDPAYPYVDRDPRLAATIIYNGSAWKGLPVQIWYGGKNAPPKVNATKTGYYLKRYVVEAVNLAEGQTTTAKHNGVIFRYGEVLLNYAEAMNEAYGPEAAGPAPLTMTALTAVNLIRTRAGMPVFSPGMSQAAFRTKLRNERRVELAFEDHRFWDIRRWKIGNTTTAIYGVDVAKDASNNITYTRKLVEQRVWNDRMYFYPIPLGEIYINSKLTQNPGW